MFFMCAFHMFICEAATRRYISFINKHHDCLGFRYSSSIPPGFKLADISRAGLAPWVDKNQNKQTEQSTIDISKFCADHESGVLYRYQSAKEFAENKEKFPLFKTNTTSFDRFVTCTHMADVFFSMGLVESFYNLGDSGVITTLGTGFLVRPDAVLTAGHNLTIDPKDCDKIKSSMEPERVKFHLRYDEGASSHIHTVSDYKMPKEWQFGRDNAYDFSVLFLKNSIQETKIRLASVEKNMKLPIPVRVAGYPDQVPSVISPKLKVRNNPLCSYTHDGDLKEISDCYRLIGYNCLTEEGVSGGPVLIRDWPIVIGIHTRGQWDLNRGVHYSDHMEVYLEKWFKERQETNQEKEHNSDIVMNIINELAQSDSEREYLISKIDKFKSYPLETVRSYIASAVDLYRP